MSKMSKEKKDSLLITRYLLDKMGEDRELGWFNMLGELSDDDVSEYGMSINQLNGMVVYGNRLGKVWDNKINLIDCKGLDDMDRLGW